MSLLFLAGCESSDNFLATLQENNSAIIGGSPARNEDAVTASTVSMIIDFDGTPFSICTGTLISKNLILTASHCVEQMEAEDISISFGTQLPTDFTNAKLVKVTSLKTHPDFKMIFDENEEPITGQNDIALLRIEQNAPDTARPVPVLTDKRPLPPGQSLLLAGFGLVNEIGDPVYATELNYTYVPLARVQDNFLITDQTNAKGACSGDSGGPAYVETAKGLVVVGVTRGPHAKALDCRHYGEYTHASKFESFILETAKELSAEAPQFIDLPTKL